MTNEEMCKGLDTVKQVVSDLGADFIINVDMIGDHPEVLLYCDSLEEVLADVGCHITKECVRDHTRFEEATADKYPGLVFVANGPVYDE